MVEVFELVGLAVKVAEGVKEMVGGAECVEVMLDTAEALSWLVVLGEPVAEGEGEIVVVVEAQLVVVPDWDSVAVRLLDSVVVTLGVEVAELEPLAEAVPLPAVPLAVLDSLAVVQEVAVWEALAVPPAALMLTVSVGDCVIEADTERVLAQLMEGEAEAVPLKGVAETETEGERVPVVQPVAEREAVGDTVPVAVLLPGVAVGEVEAEALLQVEGLLVGLPVRLLPLVSVAVAEGVVRMERLALTVAEWVALTEGVVLGLEEEVPEGEVVLVAMPVMVGLTLALGLRVEVALAVAVEVREKVGVAVALGVEALSGLGVT